MNHRPFISCICDMLTFEYYKAFELEVGIVITQWFRTKDTGGIFVSTYLLKWPLHLHFLLWKYFGLRHRNIISVTVLCHISFWLLRFGLSHSVLSYWLDRSVILFQTVIRSVWVLVEIILFRFQSKPLFFIGLQFFSTVLLFF